MRCRCRLSIREEKRWQKIAKWSVFSFLSNTKDATTQSYVDDHNNYYRTIHPLITNNALLLTSSCRRNAHHPSQSPAPPQNEGGAQPSLQSQAWHQDPSHHPMPPPLLLMAKTPTHSATNSSNSCPLLNTKDGVLPTQH